MRRGEGKGKGGRGGKGKGFLSSEILNTLLDIYIIKAEDPEKTKIEQIETLKSTQEETN